MSKTADSKCVTTEKWDPLANDFSQPRPNKLKGKNIYINNTQIRANLVLQTPLMRTWGISVYVNDAGEQQGGYSMSLVFDKEGYATEEATVFQKKVQQFEEEIVSKAYENRLAWFGDDDISLDTIRSGFYPMLKYPKMKDAKGQPLKKLDKSKAPTMKLRVNNYDNVWQCRVYDTNLQPLFVPEDKGASPIDFVPKSSQVITKIKCDGIWTGSAGISWGVKWNLQVCVVQPIEKVSADPFGMSDMDTSKFVNVAAANSALLQGSESNDVKTNEVKTKVSAQKVSETHVDDSDDEEDVPVTKVQEEVLQVAKEEVLQVAKEEVVKQVAKEVEEQVTATEAPKKKVIKKVVAK